MRTRLYLATAIFSLLALPVFSGRVPSQKKGGVVEETDSESLWTVKYAHCDYGFYVLLPEGFVGHSSLPFYPNHGFLVGLPDPTTVQPVSVEDSRFVSIRAEYNSTDSQSLNGIVDHLLDLTGRNKKGFKVIERQAVRFNNLQAIQFMVEYDSLNDVAIENETVVVRAGIIYEIGMRTTKPSYLVDEGQLQRIRAGFRFWKIHYC